MKVANPFELVIVLVLMHFVLTEVAMSLVRTVEKSVAGGLGN